MIDKVLCLDIGNSRIKWGVCELATLDMSHRGVAKELGQAGDGFSDISPMPVWVSSVASRDVNDSVSQWFEENWRQRLNFIKPEPEFKGLKNAYKVSEDLGVDRWLAMVSARSFSSGDYCVIDAGTALTIDVVSSTGEHQGGLIMPGLSLMAVALSAGTANINQVIGKQKTLADNTVDAVASGIMTSWLGGIEKALSEVRQKHPGCVVFVTGGDAEKVKSINIDNVVYNNDLVLLGVGLKARDHYA